MAIIYNKDNFLNCKNCGSKKFVEKETFTLQEESLRKGNYLIKKKSDKQIYCAKCNTNMEDIINLEIME